MFQLYAALGDDGRCPSAAPELRTFHADADTGDADRGGRRHRDQPGRVTDLLEWIAWLLFDGRRSALR